MAKEGYEKAKVLVTGGAGCIGSNLTRALLAQGVEHVAVLDDLSAAYAWNIPVDPRVRFVHGSVLDDEVLRHAFSSRPDYVFHLAAQFANQNSIDHPIRISRRTASGPSRRFHMRTSPASDGSY